MSKQIPEEKKMLRITPKLPSWTETETAYIAGIVDGEGCIGIYNRWNRGYFIQLTITNTDKQFLKWVSKMMNGNMVKPITDRRPKNKPSFQMTLDRLRAFEVLIRIQPFLRIKTKQANLAIEFKRWQNDRKTGNGNVGHRTYTSEDRNICANFVRQSHILNKRGRDK